MINFKFSNVLKTVNYKLQATGGYAALFSFAVMLTVFSVIVGVFASVALKSAARVRLNTSDLKNIYAAEGFAEDVLRRATKDSLADALDGEVLTVNEAEVTLTLSLEGSDKRHKFLSILRNRYSNNQTLLFENVNPSQVKIKEWKESF